MRTSISVLVGLLISGLGSTSSQAMEIQLQMSRQRVTDPSMAMLSDEDFLAGPGIRLSYPLPSRPRLAWVAGYEFSSSSVSHYTDSYEIPYEDYGSSTSGSSTFYPYEAEVDASLITHTIEAGIQWHRPIRRWLVPYVSLTAKGYLGRLTLSDNMQWGDQTYPVKDTGFGVGLRASAGLSLLFKQHGPRPTVVAMRFAQDEPLFDAGDVETDLPSDAVPSREPQTSEDASDKTTRSSGTVPSAGTAASSEEAPPPSEKGVTQPVSSTEMAPEDVLAQPHDATESQPESSSTGGGLAPRQAPPSSLDPPASPSRPVAPAPNPGEQPASQAPIPPVQSSEAPQRILLPTRTDATPSSWGWGLNAEAGYSLLGDLKFADSGSLDMGRLYLQFGVLVRF